MTTPPISPAATYPEASAHESFLARVAHNRAVPTDAAGAYLQAIAIAVADELELRERVKGAIRSEELLANTEQQRLESTAADASLAATSPLEALYCKNFDLERVRLFHSPKQWPQVRAKGALAFAIKHGILPDGTAKLPDTQAQFLAYAIARPRLFALINPNA